MPLFDITPDFELVPFRSRHGESDLYERKIGALLWANLEDFTGAALFPVARQPKIAVGET